MEKLLEVKTKDINESKIEELLDDAVSACVGGALTTTICNYGQCDNTNLYS
ncbi:hypothetical protein [Gayadomonas joobiniege]|uniref:hypothetical protein n=1 Tax=Gayadomonas joobiniege TaxID=1234606 RepID=UPI0003799E45|nr:hypothetical protein [Gayadomonas joobiniege]